MRKLTRLLTASLLILAWACESPNNSEPDPTPTPTPTPTPAPVEVSSVSLNQTSVDLVIGETVTLSATVSPSDATDKNVTWSSSDSNVASVTDGTVKGIALGSATITAAAGDKKASCTVTVVNGGFPEGELPPGNEIWYTTSDNKPIALVNDQGSCILASNTYSKGMGVLSFHGPLTSIEVPLTSNADDGLRLTGILIPEGVETSLSHDSLLGDTLGWLSLEQPVFLNRFGEIETWVSIATPAGAGRYDHLVTVK